jgi:serine/threonine protein kinase
MPEMLSGQPEVSAPAGDLEAVLANYLRAAEDGRAPDRMELLARHPDLAPELATFFAGQDQLGRLTAPLREAVSAVQESTIEEKLAESGRLGDFRILREIGRGGMGVVYEAEQISLGRRVALKVLPFASALDGKQLQRFKNEAQAAAGLQHTNIVPVYFVGCERGVHFYAMQFVEGQTLAALIQELRQLEGREAGVKASGAATKSWAAELISGQAVPPGKQAGDPKIARSSPLPPFVPPYQPGVGLVPSPTAETITPPVGARSTERTTNRPAIFQTVAKLGIQAAEALEHAHSLGVIHRDIKPGNLMVDARGNLWITDFGLAHCQGAVELTMSGDLLGTLRYMSPEQALAQRVLVDQRTDIYSLGVTLYELLTLKPAFPGSDRQEVLRQIAFDDPRPPRRINKAVPAELETIVLKAMEKNPVDRYVTAQELADDLQHFLDDKPIRARRPTPVQRVRKWTRRHPGVVRTAIGALFGAVVVLAVSTGLVLHHLHRAEEAERDKTDKLWHEKFALAQAIRRSGRTGQRLDSLQALAEAAEIARSLNVPEEEMLKLRNEAIACMTLPDLQLKPEYDRYTAEPPGWLDMQLERYATADDQGNITIRGIGDGQELFRLRGPGLPVLTLHFSPNGVFVVVAYSPPYPHATIRAHVIIWDLARAEVALELPREFSNTQDLRLFGPSQAHWSPNSRLLAVCGSSGVVAIFDVVSRKEVQRFPAAVTRNQIAFHPNGKQVAVLASGVVQIRDAESGSLVDQFAFPERVMHFAWGCDGRFMAAAHIEANLINGEHRHAFIWDVTARRLHKILQGHGSNAVHVAFNHAGNLLASAGWDDTVRLWNPWTGKELFRADARCGVLEFTADDGFLVVGADFGAHAGARRCLQVLTIFRNVPFCQRAGVEVKGAHHAYSSRMAIMPRLNWLSSGLIPVGSGISRSFLAPTGLPWMPSSFMNWVQPARNSRWPCRASRISCSPKASSPGLGWLPAGPALPACCLVIFRGVAIARSLKAQIFDSNRSSLPRRTQKVRDEGERPSS